MIAALSTVRGRSTALAALVVALAMVIGAIALLSAYRSQLLGNLDQALEQQATDRARLLERGNDPELLITALQEESLVWIGTPDGQTIAVSATVTPLENPVPPEVGRTTTLDLLVNETKPNEVEREVMELRIASASAANGQLVVIAGAELETVDDAVTALARLFAIGSPLLVALVAALTWFTTGRALRPVEDIRARAAAISGTTLSDRVPVPESKDEIGNLAETMNAMLDRIESHEYSLRQFSADASHELKSPVANLRALVDTASITDPNWAVLRGQLVGESDRLRDLVENLLFLASHEAGRPPDRTELVSLDELLFGEAELLAATGSVTVDLGGVAPAQIQGSASDLARLVRNLVDNAARHATTTVALAVSSGDDDGADAASQGSGVTMTVGDDGPGIATEDHDKVFERFTRLDEARARTDGGSGLGLAIVRQIAEGHDGTVTIGSSPLGGAEFRVLFP